MEKSKATTEEDPVPLPLTIDPYSVIVAPIGGTVQTGMRGVAIAGLNATESKPTSTAKAESEGIAAITGHFGTAITGHGAVAISCGYGTSVCGSYGVAMVGESGHCTAAYDAVAFANSAGTAVATTGVAFARVGGTATVGSDFIYEDGCGVATVRSIIKTPGIELINKAISGTGGISSLTGLGKAIAGDSGIAVAWNGGSASAGVGGVIIFGHSGVTTIPAVPAQEATATAPATPFIPEITGTVPTLVIGIIGQPTPQCLLLQANTLYKLNANHEIVLA